MPVYILRVEPGRGQNVNDSFWKVGTTAEVDRGLFTGVLWLSFPAGEAGAALITGVLDAYVTTSKPVRDAIVKAFKGKDGLDARLYAGEIADDGYIRDRVVNVTEISGTARNDSIEGTRGIDDIFGNAGNDKIWGGGGSDFLFGGRGDDFLWGGAGDDKVYGGSGEDLLRGGAGRDALYGGGGRDRLYGESDWDILVGGSGTDRLYGGDGWDKLSGGAGRDKLYGGAGSDNLAGGRGDDRLFGGKADFTSFGLGDVISGGGGDDWIFGTVGTFEGGGGQDRFVIEARPQVSGAIVQAVRVLDFAPGVDKLDLSRSGYGGLDEFAVRTLSTSLTLTAGDRRAGDAQVTTIEIRHAAGEQLSETDFIF